MNNDPILTQTEVLEPFSIYSVKFDEFVLLNTTLNSVKMSNHPFYWRVLSENGLVEVGLENPSGILISVAVKLFTGQMQQFKNITNFIETEYEGIPKFSTTLWKTQKDPYDTHQYFVDVRNDFEIQIGAESLRVLFSLDEIRYLVNLPDRISCELNKNKQLCSISVARIVSEEIQTINEYVTFHRDKRKYP